MDEPRPPVPAELPYNPVRRIRNDGTRLIRIVQDHGVDRPVPACPGWTLGDLLWHVGEVWNFWGRVVAERMTTLDEVRTIGDGRRPRDAMLIDLVAAAHSALLSALVRAPRDQEAWTWTGANRDAAWVRRRMTQETAVHRWDAADAVGLPYTVPRPVAADGIDEFLAWHAGRDRAPGAQPVAGSVHLHCTDADRLPAGAGGEWMVTSLEAERGAAFTREHAKGDAAVRGRSDQLLLWLWRRSDHGIEILGDAQVAERFRSFTDLD